MKTAVLACGEWVRILPLPPIQKVKMKKNNSMEQEEQYVEFLRKRLASDNFKANESQEVIDKTKRKYDKAKLKLNMMRKGFWKQNQGKIWIRAESF